MAGAALFFASVSWWECPGGGGGSSASSGGSGSQTFQGVIGGFGSVLVNGVHFDVSNSQVEVNGNAGAENDLQVGMQKTYDYLKAFSADGTRITEDLVFGW